MKPCSLADQHEKNANVHRVAHVAVQRGDDEKLRRSERRWRARSTHGKLPMHNGTRSPRPTAGRRHRILSEARTVA